MALTGDLLFTSNIIIETAVTDLRTQASDPHTQTGSKAPDCLSAASLFKVYGVCAIKGYVKVKPGSAGASGRFLFGGHLCL